MKINRFTGADMRETMRLVRARPNTNDRAKRP
jgi:flagellar biosynthesis GTPase FlhF